MTSKNIVDDSPKIYTLWFDMEPKNGYSQAWDITFQFPPVIKLFFGFTTPNI